MSSLDYFDVVSSVDYFDDVQHDFFDESDGEKLRNLLAVFEEVEAHLLDITEDGEEGWVCRGFGINSPLFQRFSVKEIITLLRRLLLPPENEAP